MPVTNALNLIFFDCKTCHHIFSSYLIFLTSPFRLPFPYTLYLCFYYEIEILDLKVLVMGGAGGRINTDTWKVTWKLVLWEANSWVSRRNLFAERRLRKGVKKEYVSWVPDFLVPNSILNQVQLYFSWYGCPWQWLLNLVNIPYLFISSNLSGFLFLLPIY